FKETEMLNRKNLASALFASSFGLMLSSAAMADDDYNEMMATVKAAGLIPIEQAADKALAAKPGKITDSDLDERTWPKGWDYEFEIFDANGKEWEVNVDAQTGEVGKVKRDWF
ncbi:MAG TPA: PepSY domain-containing protein, partial [Methylophilaceae bacterium]|nr:PepSY domain-containing protein [Methylophilaceae bacterium]